MRHGRVLLWTSVAVFIGVIVVMWMMPVNYESKATILTTGHDLSSEVGLLTNRDLLLKVASAVGLDTREIQNNLQVTSIEKTNIIKLMYRSRDPLVPASVLKTLLQ